MDDFPLDQKIPFEIKFMSDSVSKISENTVAYYQVCPVDNPDKNLIVVNPAFEDDRFNTLAHEGTPGHMFQFWYFRNTNPNPGRQLAFNLGYIEGWAVYASYQAQDNCDFEGNFNDNYFCNIDILLSSQFYNKFYIFQFLFDYYFGFEENLILIMMDL